MQLTSTGYSPYCSIDVWPGHSPTPNIGCIYAPYDMQLYYNATLGQWW
jgi:hypothetical protein